MGIGAIRPKIPFTTDLRLKEATRLLQVGGDLFIRTTLLTLFILLATRFANQISVASGAAHQAIRQVWIVSALSLDAIAITAQTLVGYFIGAGWITQAKRVAFWCLWWSLGLGVLLAAVMLLGMSVIERWLIPPEAVDVFRATWWAASIIQPINAVAFLGDGLQWGSSDYRFMRNTMILSTAINSALLFGLEGIGRISLLAIWLTFGSWVGIRAVLVILRVWPGIGNSPFNQADMIDLSEGKIKLAGHGAWLAA